MHKIGHFSIYIPQSADNFDTTIVFSFLPVHEDLQYLTKYLGH